MKIICSCETLASYFEVVRSIARIQSPKPILRNVKMEVRDEEIVLFATDMEMGARISFPCEQILEAGTVLLPSDLVGKILKQLYRETLTIESNKNQVVIKGGESQFEFSTEDPEEFPGIPVFSENNYIVTKARYFKEGIKRTNFATDSESGRYALGGIFMDFKEGSLNFVSTDGRRMATQQIEASVHGEYPEQKTAIATTRSLDALARLLTNADADISLALLDNCFMVQTENLFFYSSLLEGRFPDWRIGLNQLRNPKSMMLPFEEFTRCIRQAEIMADSTSPGVLLEFGNGKMTISKADVGKGKLQTRLAVDFHEDEMALKLNVDFIVKFLGALDSESVVKMNFVDSRTGVLFETNDGYRYLVMPMQLDVKKQAG
ncbi:MAG: DNA polymerase III subunit beta [Thermoguttaceae bacterium]|nr:DNA polymerase III subunit beta [Thermoguttaceae bacterium]